MNDTDQPVASDRVVCPATKGPIERFFIVAAMALAFGLWTGYDAYVLGKYPYPNPYNINEFGKHVFNHYGPVVFIPLALVLVAWGVWAMRRVLVADGEGVGYEGGARLSWTGIQAVDASRLKDKGILVLRFQGGRKLVLDSWKLRNFKDLVAFVEAHLPPEIHIGM